MIEAPAITIAIAFTVSVFLLDDFTKYFYETLHRCSFYGPFKVHHSQKFSTIYFFGHILEALLFTIRTIIVRALTISTFLFFFGDKADLLTILGANIFLFVFNAVGANLRHSHVDYLRPNYGKALISPAQHQIHILKIRCTSTVTLSCSGNLGWNV